MNLPTDTNLHDWVQTFLRGPGNNIGFAEGLNLEPRTYFGPLLLPLGDLKRCCGPEPGMKYPVPSESFEVRVEGLRAFRRTGGEVPPLIVNFTAGQFELNDGNHRHEALTRDGVAEFPVIVWTTGAADRDGFEEAYGPWLAMDKAWNEGNAQGRQGVVGCLVTRPDGRVFAQKRSPDRRTFPGCWDLVGGHIEPGESPRQALVRELAEETGWVLDRVLGLRKVVDWEAADAKGAPQRRRELVVAVSVKGGWDEPALERGKVTEGRWFGPGDLEVLNENRPGSDSYVYDLFREEFARS